MENSTPRNGEGQNSNKAVSQTSLKSNKGKQKEIINKISQGGNGSSTGIEAKTSSSKSKGASTMGEKSLASAGEKQDQSQASYNGKQATVKN